MLKCGPVSLESAARATVKRVARPIVWMASDLVSSLRGELIPPRKLRAGVPGDFREVGRQFLGYFRDLAGLRPDHSVLDIGCGPGRMAIPLTGYLSARGSYLGIDTWAEAVEWCTRNITSRHPNFRFDAISVPSESGDRRVGAGQFDLVILGAISKLDMGAFRAYLDTAGSALHDGGRYVGTCFVVGDGPEPGPEPAHPVTFGEAELHDVMSRAGLSIDSVHRGSWSGHRDALSYQDVIVATKTTAQS